MTALEWVLLVAAVVGWGFTAYAMWEWRRSIARTINALVEWTTDTESWEQERAILLDWDIREAVEAAEAERDTLRHLAERCVSPFIDGEDSPYTQGEALRDLEDHLRATFGGSR